MAKLDKEAEKLSSLVGIIQNSIPEGTTKWEVLMAAKMIVSCIVSDAVIEGVIPLRDIDDMFEEVFADIKDVAIYRVNTHRYESEEKPS